MGIPELFTIVFVDCIKLWWLPIAIAIIWAIISWRAQDDKAREFLIDVLKDGPVLIQDLKAAAKQRGIQEASLIGAARSLKVASEPRDGRLYWRMSDG